MNLVTSGFTSRYWGGGADCVMLRTFSTLDVKKAAKSCGENGVEFGTLLRPKTASNVCQRRAGLVEFAACDRQNRLLFCSTRRWEVLSACSHDSLDALTDVAVGRNRSVTCKLEFNISSTRAF